MHTTLAMDSFPRVSHVFTLVMSFGFYAYHTRYGSPPPAAFHVFTPVMSIGLCLPHSLCLLSQSSLVNDRPHSLCLLAFMPTTLAMDSFPRVSHVFTLAMDLFPPCLPCLHTHYVSRLLCQPHSLWIPSPSPLPYLSCLVGAIFHSSTVMSIEKLGPRPDTMIPQTSTPFLSLLASFFCAFHTVYDPFKYFGVVSGTYCAGRCLRVHWLFQTWQLYGMPNNDR